MPDYLIGYSVPIGRSALNGRVERRRIPKGENGEPKLFCATWPLDPNQQGVPTGTTSEVRAWLDSHGKTVRVVEECQALGDVLREFDLVIVMN